MSGFLGFFKKRSTSQDASPEKGRKAPSDSKKQASRSRNNVQGKSSKRPKQTGSRKPGRHTPAQESWSIDQFQVAPDPEKTRFHDFELPSELMHAVADQGFKYCTPIQAEVLGSTLAGRDAIGKAQTGTGKTAAFLISTIKQLIDTPAPDKRYLGEPRAVIIAPTRELALQIGNDAEALTQYLPLHVVTVVGGMDYEKQRKRISENYVDILVATPGRLLDYCERKDLFLDLVEVMVIDEADRMLDMGFIPQVRRIIRMTPRPGDRQTLLFSATFTDDVLRLGEQWTWNPVKVEIEPDSVATDTVEQKVYILSSEQKFPLLVNLINHHQLEKVIVFTNRRDQTRKLTEKLQKVGIKADQISGEVPQNKRLRTLENFRSGKISVLVATDVAGRGIHIDGISHVINYNLPEDPDDYVHRIGRTGRAGASGTSISFACEDDSFLIPDLEALLGDKLNKDYPPEQLLIDPRKSKPH
ncbi:ATP-dependent RNA helicase RhlB [Endozoicomonas sp. SCSIO W0465]|uniref:ATP-dependent RNA helicase RhlB n=1 Tax=Endozoicomonas sp. SCSIO W0465 TaxID=2918516 RepID=UPI00207615FD|nr:ATP-dependent RNA helicase RhlB [Endozoicomonas sp. SCSIO W0465]USE38402.1 ATP-dependent RNA helicase RhlB [Endozoicomonas sp. SCSIO W0465]